jgi:hypothetical protein
MGGMTRRNRNITKETAKTEWRIREREGEQSVEEGQEEKKWEEQNEEGRRVEGSSK